MNLTIIGTGYVGLVSAACFAHFGHQVCGLDIDPEKIKLLNQAKSPIYEPGIEELLKKGLKKKNLSFTNSYQEALAQAEIIFICVGTPQDEKGQIELLYLYDSIDSIAKNLTKKTIIVLKSTVPPGIHKKLEKRIAKITKIPVEFASIPEFLKEGTAVSDTLNPDRIVIGTESEKVKKTLLALHQDFPGERLTTDIVSAQLIKYTANSFLATKISFANAISRVCDLLGADVNTVMKGISLDRRISPHFLNAGIGFGGSCFPKDLNGLYYLSKQNAYDFNLLRQVSKINHDQVLYYLTKTEKIIKSFAHKKIAILGLAFKPETDDMRDAPVIPLINYLLEKKAKVFAYDPIAQKTAQNIFQNKINYCQNKEEAINQADAIFLVTEWQEFKKMNLKAIKLLMKGDIFIDGRNIFDPQKMDKLGFRYISVGRN